MTASRLFAGADNRIGDERCYYCGDSCDDTNHVEDFVKDTFTNRDIIAHPGSKFVCVGCSLSLGAGPDVMKTVPIGPHLQNLTGYRKSFGGAFPPYWHPETYREIAIPC